MDDIYRENIIDHYKNPRHFGKLENPTVSHEEVNSLCGDRIGMDLMIENDQLVDAQFTGVGCAVSMASASMLMEKIVNLNIDQAENVTKKEVVENLGIPMSPTRLKCALLPWEVLQKALQKYQINKL